MPMLVLLIGFSPFQRSIRWSCCQIVVDPEPRSGDHRRVADRSKELVEGRWFDTRPGVTERARAVLVLEGLALGDAFGDQFFLRENGPITPWPSAGFRVARGAGRTTRTWRFRSSRI